MTVDSSASPNPLLDAALAYIARGWAIFPTHDVAAGACSCGAECSSPGKHPRTSHGLNDATTDEATVRAWWAKWPQANIAVNCGASGIAAIDVDVKNGAAGKATLKWVLDRHAGAFSTAELNATPTGGYHYLFGGEIKTATGTLGPGVDTRGVGGYVLLPPSRVFGQYDANKRPIAGSQAPYQLLRPAPTLPPLPDFTPLVDERPAPSGFTLSDAATGERLFLGEERHAIPYGEHRQAILQFTWHLRRVLGLSVEASIPLVEAFLEKLDGYNPDDPFNVGDIRKALTGLSPHIAPLRPEQAARNMLEEATTFNARIADYRPASFIVPYFIPERELMLLFGPGGVGKSTFFSWVCAQVTQLSGNFAFFGVEEGVERFGARAVAMGAVGERIIVPSEPIVGLKFREHLEWIEAFIQKNEIQYAYFDSLRSHFDGARGEDSATNARNNLSGLADLAQRTCGIGATFHTNKEDVYSGSTEMLNVPRIVLEAMNPTENKLVVRVHKTNFRKPDIKMAFSRGEVPFFINGAPVKQRHRQIGGPPIEVEETLPVWRRLADEPARGGSLEELAGLEAKVRELLDKDPKLTVRTAHEIIGHSRNQIQTILKRLKNG